MTGLYVPDATGQFVKITKGLWAADASGTFQPVKNGWVADATGTYKKIWPYMVSINDFEGVKGATGYPTYYALTLTWSVTNADHVELRLAGSPTVLYTGTGTSTTFAGTPGSSYTFNLRAIAADGSSTDSAPVTVKLDALPAPGNFRKTAGASSTSDWAWNAVAQSTGYQVVDTLAANAVKSALGSGVTSWHETGLVASTTYERAVQAKLGSATSPISNKVRYTTPVAPGTAPGTYDFRATYAETWSSQIGWRGTAVGLAHGDGDNWGGNSGISTSIFLYDVAAIQALSGRVTRCKVYMKRDLQAGSSAPQGNKFWLHTMTTRSGGSPLPTFGAQIDSGQLGWGQDGLFDLPVAWGQALIDNSFSYKGLGWGNVLARYMRASGLAGIPDQGHLYITIG